MINFLKFLFFPQPPGIDEVTFLVFAYLESFIGDDEYKIRLSQVNIYIHKNTNVDIIPIIIIIK